jgi:hypothetical protein
MIKNTEVAETIRRTAYFLWEEAGRPEQRDFQYWLRAKEMLLRQMAYDKWLAEGEPPGRDQAHWYDADKEIDP